MTEPGNNVHPTLSSGRRRKMRKGTKSCTECRRRKIRCIYLSGTTTCVACGERGSRCIDQRDEGRVAAEEERVTLRERVARLESLLTNGSTAVSGDIGRNVVTLDIPCKPTTEDNVEALDLELPASKTDRRAPFVSVLDDAELLWRAQETDDAARTDASQSPASPLSTRRQDGTYRNYRSIMLPEGAATRTASQQKRIEACETLRAALPRYDTMISALSGPCTTWWRTYHHKTVKASQAFRESLPEFARHAYTSNNPAEVGQLVVAYARCSDQNHHLYSLVDRLIISDLEFSTTVEGLECLLLLAKVYTDHGQPRRSWFVYRRGVGIAQLMGLYRKDSSSPQQEKIWWALYHGDRFISLLLGLPYGCYDSHYGLTMDTTFEDPGLLQQKMTLGCSIIAGKILDRNMGPSKPSFAYTMNLDEQMDALGSSMPSSWWEPPTTLPNLGPELDQLRDRLLQHFYFFHVRTYLHLPFIVKSSIASPYDHSRLTCLESSRQLLKRFLLLRSKVQGACIWECRTTDFIGFMAAIVLLISPSGTIGTSNLRASDEDALLLKSVIEIFEVKSAEGCKIATTCLRTLSLLSGTQEESDRQDQERDKILIPYFGNVMLRRANAVSGRTPSASTLGDNDVPSSPLLTPGATTGPRTAEGNGQGDVQHFDDWNYSYPSTLLGDTHWEVDGFGNFTVDNISSWIDLSLVNAENDIDMCLNVDGFFG